MRAWKKERVGSSLVPSIAREVTFRVWTAVGAEMGPGLREYVDQKKKQTQGDTMVWGGSFG